uniref:Uncharacterized protein n=1 Tax=Anguilla anguilla TaxID=7936 RepID=A0A0E9RVH2_ANGAN
MLCSKSGRNLEASACMLTLPQEGAGFLQHRQRGVRGHARGGEAVAAETAVLLQRGTQAAAALGAH